jgi:hypothetical protein
MHIDPRWSFFLSLFISILNFLAGSTAQFAALGLNTNTVNVILAMVTLVTGILSLINTALAAIPSKAGQTAGFYLGPAKPDPPPKP